MRGASGARGVWMRRPAPTAGIGFRNRGKSRAAAVACRGRHPAAEAGQSVSRSAWCDTRITRLFQPTYRYEGGWHWRIRRGFVRGLADSGALGYHRATEQGDFSPIAAVAEATSNPGFSARLMDRLMDLAESVP